ncbi:MAG: hypothetical protein NWF02_09065 [Candidatus Bathyarchaeota archaeon]|nr:hypothetical protein [Candidatus Bathyarchaeum sp.]
MPYIVLFKHQLKRNIRGKTNEKGALLKISKIVAFSVLVDIWLTGWTVYSNNPKAQVSDEKWKMIIIPRENYKK